MGYRARVMSEVDDSTAFATLGDQLGDLGAQLIEARRRSLYHYELPDDVPVTTAREVAAKLDDAKTTHLAGVAGSGGSKRRTAPEDLGKIALRSAAARSAVAASSAT